VRLATCLSLQAIPIFGTTASISLALFIGVDQLVSATFPMWHTANKMVVYLSSIVGACAAYSLGLVYICLRGVQNTLSTFPNRYFQ
jgi:hypothetical protein